MADFLKDLGASLGLDDLNKDAKPKTVEKQTIESKKQKAAKANKGVKKEAHKWTSTLRDRATAEEIRFQSTTREDRQKNARKEIENFEPSKDASSLLASIEASGVGSHRVISMKSLQPSVSILEARKEKERFAKERSMERLLKKRLQKKNTYDNRQKGKYHRRLLKKKVTKDTEKILDALRDENPEVAAIALADMKKKAEDTRASMRMMGTHSSRKKWARIAQKFGNKEAVDEAAATSHDAKKENEAVLKRIGEEDDDEGSYESVSSDEGSGYEGEDSSDSEVQLHSGSSDESEEDSEAEAPQRKKRAAPSTPTPVEPSRKKRKRIKDISAVDLSGVIGDQGEAVRTADMFVGDGAAEEEEVVRDIALLSRTEAEKDEKDTEELAGWGNGWAGENYIQQIEDKKAEREAALEAEVSAQRKKPLYVNRKVSEKFEKYLLKSLPPGFANKEEYDLKQSQSLGPEWNAQQAFKDKTKRRINVEAGAIIQPIARPTTERRRILPKL